MPKPMHTVESWDKFKAMDPEDWLREQQNAAKCTTHKAGQETLKREGK